MKPWIQAGERWTGFPIHNFSAVNLCYEKNRTCLSRFMSWKSQPVNKDHRVIRIWEFDKREPLKYAFGDSPQESWSISCFQERLIKFWFIEHFAIQDIMYQNGIICVIINPRTMESRQVMLWTKTRLMLFSLRSPRICLCVKSAGVTFSLSEEISTSDTRNAMLAHTG